MNKGDVKKRFNIFYSIVFVMLFFTLIFLSSQDELALRLIMFFAFSFFQYKFLKSVVFKEPYIEGIRTVKNDGQTLACIVILMTFICYVIVLAVIVFFHKQLIVG